MLVSGVQINVSKNHNFVLILVLAKFNTAIIGNITASFSDTQLRLTWNLEHNRVISFFEIKCFYTYDNTTHIAQSTVFHDQLSVQLNSLASSTLYNCCVSAVLGKYSSTTCIAVSTLAPDYSMSTV